MSLMNPACPELAQRLESACVSLNGVFSDAMRSLDKSAAEIALVTNEEMHLVGVLTDGDIRRALLKGATLESPIEPYVVREFSSVQSNVCRAHVLDLMKARELKQIPIVASNGKLVGLHLLHELIGSAARPNWAVVMAGGKGMRLRPITEHIPKPMIPVAGRPILERILLHLVGSGISRVFISVNYLGHIIEEYFGDGSRYGCRIEYLRETKPLGTGGALSLLPCHPVEPLLVLNGDLVTQADVGAMLDFHQKGRYLATLGMREYVHSVPFGCVEVENGCVTRIEEKPILTRHINAGIYVLNPELLNQIPGGQEFAITRLFDECVRSRERVGAYAIEDDWIDVGQKEHLRIACEGTA